MDLLNLPHLKVVEVKENEFDYGIYCETTFEGEPHCPQCGFTDLYKHGTLKQMFWDIPLHAKRTGLFFKRQRYKCKQCSSTFMEPIPNMDEKRTMTSRLVEYIERQSLKETFTKLAEQVGCDEKTIRNVFNEFVERMEKKHEVSTPKWIGVDEIHLNKKMRFVITDIENRLLLDVVRERDKLRRRVPRHRVSNHFGKYRGEGCGTMRKRVKEVPIATVTWIDANGWDMGHPVYTQNELESFITELRRENVAYIVCMTSVSHALPVKRARTYGKAM